MRLPPLNSLKAFEATARCGGFTAAAIELGVSSAAVSMQVRKLEQFLAKDLFHRTNNSITLTDAGLMLYPQVEKSLLGLSHMTDRFLDSDRRSRLVLSTIQSLAEKLLAPVLARIKLRHPDLGMDVRIEDDPVDLKRERIDLRLCSGSQFYPGIPMVELCRDRAVPVGLQHSALAELFQSDPGAINDEALIHVDWGQGYASYPKWSQWFQAAGFRRFPDSTAGLRVGGTAVAVSLALQGAGIALAPAALCRQEIASGKLAHLSEIQVLVPQPYFAVVPNLRERVRSKPDSNQEMLSSLMAELQAEIAR